MEGTNESYTTKEQVVDRHSNEDVEHDESKEKSTDLPEQLSMPSHEEEEIAIKKKYGGIVPKKPPLISKDHERAFFDSADWALGKQGGPVGQKPKGPLEALRPKLQPTPQQQARSCRTSYARNEDGTVISSEEPNGQD